MVVDNDPVFRWPSGATLNLETPTWGSLSWSNGDSVEGRVAGALWDIVDARNDGDDIYSDGSIAHIWDLLTSTRSATFRQWWDDWRARGYSSVSWGPIMGCHQNTINYRTGPANDDFAAARQINTQPFNVKGLNTANATTQGLDPETPCGSTVFRRQGHSVWYSYMPTSRRTYTISTTGSNYDTVLSVWGGSWGSLVNRACNDNSSGRTTSSLTVTLEGGVRYYIEVAVNGGFSAGLLNLFVYPESFRIYIPYVGGRR